MTFCGFCEVAGMAMRRMHCCLDIEGGIRNAKDIKGCITIDGRTLMTTEEVKEALRYQLALGRRVPPKEEHT